MSKEKDNFPFKKALVIGLGSAGVRHLNSLKKQGLTVDTVSSHHPEATYPSIAEIGDLTRFEYIVIASETRAHREALQQIRAGGFTGRVLVEKPLFHKMLPEEDLLPEQTFVAYNLRYHPGLQLLREELAQQTICSLLCVTGQHLSGWSKNRAYQSTYRARAEDGGVLRDLSHELDYLAFLTGRVTELTALGGHFSALETSSDDSFSLLMKTERAPLVSLNLDYLQDPPSRLVTINSTAHTYRLDLIGATLTKGSELLWRGTSDEIQKTTDAMHIDLMRPTPFTACSFAEGIQTLKVIDAAFSASSSRTWVEV
jgi:predicted dehydrogenase